MGKNAEHEAGAIYRFYRGEVVQLYASITISNSIAFSPDHRVAYFCDSLTRRIMRQALSESDGFPVGKPEVFVELKQDGVPDGLRAILLMERSCLKCFFWRARWVHL